MLMGVTSPGHWLIASFSPMASQEELSFSGRAEEEASLQQGCAPIHTLISSVKIFRYGT